jgi:hypothetical protein
VARLHAEAVLARFAGRVPALPVALFRVAFALIVLLRTSDVTRGLVHFRHHARVRGLEYAPNFDVALAPALNSPLIPGLSLGPEATWLLVVVRTLSAGLLLVGVYSRTAALSLAVSGFWLMAADRYRYFHHLHLLWLTAAWLCLVPSGQRLSLGRWLTKRPGSATLPSWPVELLRLQCVGVYLASGIAKLDTDWLSGLTLQRVERVTLIGGKLWNAAVSWVGHQWLAVAICVIELALVPLLLVRSTRSVGVGMAVLLHILITTSMEVSTFGAQMLLLLGLFLIPCLDPLAATRERFDLRHGLDP